MDIKEITDRIEKESMSHETGAAGEASEDTEQAVNIDEN